MSKHKRPEKERNPTDYYIDLDERGNVVGGSPLPTREEELRLRNKRFKQQREDLTRFIESQLRELLALELPWPENFTDGPAAVHDAITAEILRSAAKAGASFEDGPAIEKILGPAVSRVWDKWHSTPQVPAGVGPDLQSGRMKYLGVDGDLLPKDVHSLRVLLGDMTATVERVADGATDLQRKRVIDPIALRRIRQYEELLDKALSKVDAPLSAELQRAFSYAVQLTAAYTRIVDSLAFAPVVAAQVRRKSRVTAGPRVFRGETVENVKLEEELKIYQLDRELKATFSKKTPRYREIAELQGLSVDRVRYIIEGPRRKKKT